MCARRLIVVRDRYVTLSLALTAIGFLTNVLDFYRINARLQDNEPRRCFAPLLGRDSDDRSFCDTRILDQLIFKIDGVYVEPSRNDHIFCPADQFDATILIEDRKSVV